MRNHRLLTACALVLLTASLASAGLKQDLDRVFSASSLADLGVQVQLLGGETLYERNAGAPFMPASNMKLVTCATSLRTWGDLCHMPAAAYAQAFGKPLPAGACAASASNLQLLREMDKISDNHLADSFMRALLTAHGASSYNDLQHAAWRHLNLPLEGCRFMDGSGLSRHNRLTARFLVSLLQYMRLSSEHAGAFVNTLPVAGRDGTLRLRMKGTAAEGCVRAKTGFLTGACTLSGYVDRGGRQVVFSMLMNNHTVDADLIRAVQNRACIAMAEWCTSPQAALP